MTNATHGDEAEPMNLQRGDEIMVSGEWYPVIGYALTYVPNAPTTGSVFTSKPCGPIGPLGYRIDYADIEQVRRPDQPAKANGIV